MCVSIDNVNEFNCVKYNINSLMIVLSFKIIVLMFQFDLVLNHDSSNCVN